MPASGFASVLSKTLAIRGAQTGVATAGARELITQAIAGGAASASTILRRTSTRTDLAIEVAGAAGTILDEILTSVGSVAVCQHGSRQHGHLSHYGIDRADRRGLHLCLRRRACVAEDEGSIIDVDAAPPVFVIEADEEPQAISRSNVPIVAGESESEVESTDDGPPPACHNSGHDQYGDRWCWCGVGQIAAQIRGGGNLPRAEPFLMK